MSAPARVVDQALLDEMVRLIVEEVQPERIILFGSRARGDAREDSDVDLLVILPQVESRHREQVRIRSLLMPLPVPVDILVVSSADFEKWSEAASTTLYWAKREGQVLYAVAA